MIQSSMLILRVFLRILLSGMILLSWSCTSLHKNVEYTDNVVIFPSPPDSARIQYLTSISTSLDITGEQSAFQRYVMGREEGKPIYKPYGISIRNNRVYICDTMLPGIEIIDLGRHTFSYFVPGGLGVLKKPVNCSVDSAGNLYVADAGRKQVVSFDAAGRFLAVIGDTELEKPTDVVVNNSEIWVCDLERHQVLVYDQLSGEVKRAFPDTTQGNPAYLYSPTNIAVYGNRIYVTDTGDSKIKVFEKSGRYTGSIGAFGRHAGQFVRPKGIDIDKEGHIFIVDAAFENVQIFNRQADVLMYFGGPYKKPGHMWLPADVTLAYSVNSYFEKYVEPRFKLEYVIFVSNQYGPDKVGVYGFVSYR